MKKYLLCLLVIFLVFCVSACTSQEHSDTSANSNDDSNLSLNGANINDDVEIDSNDDSVSLTVAEKRDLKVSFNIDTHHMGEQEKEDGDSVVLDRHLIAVLDKNKDGNEYIEYSPNAYSFYALITCQGALNDAWNIISGQINKHFVGGSKDNSTTFVDAVAIKENMIIVCFPDFYSYSLCQEEMLNKLSEKDSVLSVEIGYLNTQNGTTKPKNTYEYINVGNAFEKHGYIKSYDEFVSLLGNKIETNEKLQKITAQTFEENYVFVVVNWHYKNFDISDAKLVNDTVFFTTNRYGQNGEIHDLRLHNNACITFVPKSELGTLPEEITVRGLEVFLLTDEWYDK